MKALARHPVRLCGAPCSPVVTVALVLCFVVWIGYGTYRTWLRLGDPDARVEVELVLLHSPTERLFARGVGRFHSIATDNVAGELIGPCELVLERSDGKPRFLLLMLEMRSLPPGRRLVIRRTDPTPVLHELGTGYGRRVWVAIPVQARSERWTLDPGGPDVRYRFPDWLFSARLVPPGDRSLEPELVNETSAPIAVTGGEVRLGSGWSPDPGAKPDELPPGPFESGDHAWLEVLPGAPGEHTVRVPLEVLATSPPLEIRIDGRPVAVSMEKGVVSFQGRLGPKSVVSLHGPPCRLDVRALRLSP